jgi:UDP-N-acetylglucosamine--N-acetylmuramyl-(pentapeptide) pyrophosphoryl-undecaprenol N-acetylglucosamine transferase
MTEEKKIKIILSGGGTGGSVTSLLAIAEKAKINGKKWDFVFVGTYQGPEKGMVAESYCPMRFRPMLSGKLRRYLSFNNFIDIFKIIFAFFQSFLILHEEAPDIILSAGSFASVPLIWAAGFKRIPVIIHQQDVCPGLANKLMSPAADVITVTFAKSLADYGPKAIWIGNPTKSLDIEKYKKLITPTWSKYGLKSTKPLILVTGGRMGAKVLNELIAGAQSKLVDFQIVHLTGYNKANNIVDAGPDYHVLESISHEDFLILMISSKLVVSRAGLGALTELSELNKAAIIIPIPDSHQKNNADIFSDIGAVLVLNQKKLTPDKLAQEINSLLGDEVRLNSLSSKIGQVIRKGAALKALDLIEELLEAKNK